MGKKFFFLSLILLSIAMGINWYKTKPKKALKQISRKIQNIQKTAVEVEEESASKNVNNKIEKKTPEDNDLSDNTENEITSENKNAEKNENQNQDESQENQKIASENNNGLQTDSIILAFEKLKRDPFQPSPYIQMLKDIEKKRQEEIMTSTDKPIAIVNKPTSILNGNFLGTIEASGKLLAIIDGRLYKTGDLYNDIPILRVDREIVLLENNQARYIIPKKGVNVNIASDGSFTIEDTFFKQSTKRR